MALAPIIRLSVESTISATLYDSLATSNAICEVRSEESGRDQFPLDFRLRLAARIQQQLCIAIHRAVIERNSYRRLKRYTNVIGRPYNQFRRIMRSHAVLHLRDLAEAKVHFGDPIDLNVPALEVTR